MQPRHRLYLLIGGVVAAIIAIVAIASGGDDDDAAPVETLTGPGGVALTQADFIEQADDICAEAYAALAAFDASESEPQVVAGQKREVARGIVDSIESLGTPPTEDEAALDDFLSALERASKLFGQQERAAEQGDIGGADALGAEADAALADARAAARDYGFEDCSEQGEVPDAGDTGGGGGGAGTGGTAPPAPPPTTEPPAAPPAAPPTAPPPADGTGDTDGGTGGVSP